MDKTREVSERRVGTLIVDYPLTVIGNDRRATEVADVIGAAAFVQDQIPVDPADGPVTQIVHDRMCVTLGERPLAMVCAPLLAGLGHQQFLVGKGVVDEADVLELPTLVPMERSSPDEACCLKIAEYDLRPLDH